MAPLADNTKPKSLSVILMGNPNTGKTTLFNALTGLRHRVGNYAGVTVETKTGAAKHGDHPLEVTDVPGSYSLSPRSPDEMLAVEVLLGLRPELKRPDVIICVVDASNLERNLYLASQVFELDTPTVLALTMTDVAQSRGITVDSAALSKALGVRVVPIQAHRNLGLDSLLEQVIEAAKEPPPRERPPFPPEFLAERATLADWVRERGAESVAPFLLERAILDAGGATEQFLTQRLGADFSHRLIEARERLAERSFAVPAVEARVRYRWIGERAGPCVRRPAKRTVTFSDRLDRVLIHRVWGLAIFLLLMAILFQSLYTGADYLMSPLESLFERIGQQVDGLMPDGAIKDLIVQGVIAGVGAVVVFLPQIMILFGFIAVLEDCGYMARAAFLMDKVMARSGLSGKSFIPLLSSFACAIPGIMATRTIEDRRDRLTTILVAPLMSCSARLPVYLLMIGSFIPARRLLGFVQLQGLVLFSMYLIGLLVAPLVAWLLKRTLLKGETPVFLMELPSYKLPSPWSVMDRVVDRGRAFLTRAGTLILAANIVVWALQYYPRSTEILSRFESERLQLESQGDRITSKELGDWQARRSAALQETSLLGRLGKAIEPIVRPLGWDWRIGMAALASFPAREVVVGALGTIFSANVEDENDDNSMMLRQRLEQATWPDGRPLMNTAVALSLMVFFALCCQCGATLAMIARETRSWRWPLFTFVYMTLLAYVAALLVYQIAVRLL